MKVFDTAFLKTLSNWQKGWYEDQVHRRMIADELVIQCEKLPEEFKSYNKPCYRKRFILNGEVVPILMHDDLFEGIASWTTEVNYARSFKALVRPGTSFVMVFKHIPKPGEVIVNIQALWKDNDFISAKEIFRKEWPDDAAALMNFKDSQSEVVLRSTLKGSEIEHIVGVSSSFEELCDKANIPIAERSELSKRYAQDPNGIPVEFPTLGSSKASKNAVQRTIQKMKEKIKEAPNQNVTFSGLEPYVCHPNDLKHRV